MANSEKRPLKKPPALDQRAGWETTR